MSYPNQIIEHLHTLRTIHGNFTQDKVSPEHQEIIINTALRAANSSSLQAYSILSISDQEIMKQISGFSGTWALLFLADTTRYDLLEKQYNFPSQEKHLSDLLTKTIDASLAGQNAIIAAKSLGIDSLVTNGVFRVEPNLFKKLLACPESAVPLFLIIFGYPSAEAEGFHGRYNGAGLVHFEKYHTMNTAEIAEMSVEYNDENKKLGLGVDWKSQGCNSYFQWLYAKWFSMFAKLAQKNPREDSGLIFAKRAKYIK